MSTAGENRLMYMLICIAPIVNIDLPVKHSGMATLQFSAAIPTDFNFFGFDASVCSFYSMIPKYLVCMFILQLSSVTNKYIIFY